MSDRISFELKLVEQTLHVTYVCIQYTYCTYHCCSKLFSTYNWDELFKWFWMYFMRWTNFQSKTNEGQRIKPIKWFENFLAISFFYQLFLYDIKRRTKGVFDIFCWMITLHTFFETKFNIPRFILIFCTWINPPFRIVNSFNIFIFIIKHFLPKINFCNFCFVVAFQTTGRIVAYTTLIEKFYLSVSFYHIISQWMNEQ